MQVAKELSHRIACIAALAAFSSLPVSCRPPNPPNPLTAVLRAVPVEATTLGAQRLSPGHTSELVTTTAVEGARQNPAYYFVDLAQFRRDTGGLDPSASVIPSPMQPPLQVLSDTPAANLFAGGELSLSRMEAVLVVGTVGYMHTAMLVGEFDRGGLEESLHTSLGEAAESGLFKLYSASNGGAVAVGPRRIIASKSYAAAAAITGFRGGENSLLGLPGSQELALSAGRPTVFSARYLPGSDHRGFVQKHATGVHTRILSKGFSSSLVWPRGAGLGELPLTSAMSQSGDAGAEAAVHLQNAPRICTGAVWMAAAFKYTQAPSPSAALVLQFDDELKTSASRPSSDRLVQRGLENLEARILGTDVRRSRLVYSLDLTDEAAEALTRHVADDRGWVGPSC